MGMGDYPGPNQPGKGETYLSDTPGGWQTQKPSRVSNDPPPKGNLVVRGQNNYLGRLTNTTQPFT